jgi:hypothetical protein
MAEFSESSRDDGTGKKYMTMKYNMPQIRQVSRPHVTKLILGGAFCLEDHYYHPLFLCRKIQRSSVIVDEGIQELYGDANGPDVDIME